jgi:hypothetical protein
MFFFFLFLLMGAWMEGFLRAGQREVADMLPGGF